MIISKEVENMCPLAKGAYHGPAPIPEEGKWVQVKEVKDISGLTHGIGWCAPQQGACKLTLNVKDGVIEEALVYVSKAEKAEAVKKSCQRTFQALRIDVNSEFEVLYTFLDKLPDVMAPGGRIAILTFHSGEDRLVKRSFKEWEKAGVYREVCKDCIRPSAEECARNSRAKCTKMRWAIKA